MEDNLNSKFEATNEGVEKSSSAGGILDIPVPLPLVTKQNMTAVLQEITSKNVSESLNKVTSDMLSRYHAYKKPLPVSSDVGPPKFELQLGRKWVVEHQIGRRKIVIDDCDSKQTVYVYGCQNSILHIRGKVNNITVDNCTKVGVIFRDVVAACEVVNCDSVELQCEGFTPIISVDNTSGCQIYLSKDSLESSLTTAKSSEINVMVPSSEPDGDWGEHALPQQYYHKFKNGRFVTEPFYHSAG